MTTIVTDYVDELSEIDSEMIAVGSAVGALNLLVTVIEANDDEIVTVDQLEAIVDLILDRLSDDDGFPRS